MFYECFEWRSRGLRAGLTGKTPGVWGGFLTFTAGSDCWVSVGTSLLAPLIKAWRNKFLVIYLLLEWVRSRLLPGPRSCLLLESRAPKTVHYFHLDRKLLLISCLLQSFLFQRADSDLVSSVSGVPLSHTHPLLKFPPPFPPVSVQVWIVTGTDAGSKAPQLADVVANFYTAQ